MMNIIVQVCLKDMAESFFDGQNQLASITIAIAVITNSGRNNHNRYVNIDGTIKW